MRKTSCAFGRAFHLLPFAGVPALVVIVALFMGAASRTASAAAPANDNCAGAVVIPAAGPFPYGSPLVDITSATATGELALTNLLCQNFVSRGAWYVFTPSQSGPYTISTCSASTTVDDTVLGIFTSVAGCLGPFSLVACDDDACGFGGPSSITTPLFADTTYYVLAMMYDVVAPSAGHGTIQVTVTRQAGPVNDTCDTAIPVTLGIPVTGSTVDATDNYRLSGSACFTGIGQTPSAAAGRDVVYSFMAPESGNYAVKVANYGTASGFNLVLYVAGYLAPGPGPVTVTNCLVAANRNSASSAEEASCLSLAAGEVVYVFVDDASVNAGSSFVLEVTRCVREVEPNNSVEEPSPLASGMQGSISPAGDIDYFTLGDFPQGWRAFVMVDGEAANIPDFDLRVVSLDDTLEFDDKDNDQTFGQSSPNIAGNPLPGGPTFARVTYKGNAAAEPYRIYGVVQPPLAQATAETEPNNVISQANSNPRNYFYGSLAGPAPSADLDVYALTVSDGDLIYIGLDADPLRNNTPIDAKLELLDDSGNVLVTADDANRLSNTNASLGTYNGNSPNSPAESIVFRSPVEGVYFVRVSLGASAVGASGAGDYLLSISKNCTTGSEASRHPVVMSNVVVNAAIAEGGRATLTGTVADLDTGESLRMTVSWGDGTSEVLSYPGGWFQFLLTHRYADDGPPGSRSVAYPIRLAVADSDGTSVSNALSVTVTNVPPAVSASFPNGILAEGSLAALQGTFVDPGVRDVHEVVIDWGDGSPESIILPPVGTRQFAANHFYPDDTLFNPVDIFVVRVTVRDENLGTNTVTVNLAVTNMPPELSNFSISSPINAGDTATLAGGIFDVSDFDEFTLTVNWGDGSAVQVFNYPPGSFGFAETHRYTSGPADRLVQVTLADDDGGSVSTTGSVHVNGLPEPALFTGFTYFAVFPNPQMHLELWGTPGFTYRIQKSSDLQNWTTVMEVTADEGGFFEAMDMLGNPKSQFYRALLLP